MASTRKQVLVLGIIKYVEERDEFPMKDASKISAMLDAEVAKAAAEGFDFTIFEINPNTAGNMEDLEKKLREKKWDGVVIGGGVRMPGFMTSTFEDAVNLVVKTGPFRMIFPAMPNEIAERCIRVLGK
jgi:hypothetical protein